MQVSFYKNIDHPPTKAGTTVGIMQQRQRPMTLLADCPAATARVQLPRVSLAWHFGKSTHPERPNLHTTGRFHRRNPLFAGTDDHP
jgi:hypothetical protein